MNTYQIKCNPLIIKEFYTALEFRKKSLKLYTKKCNKVLNRMINQLKNELITIPDNLFKSIDIYNENYKESHLICNKSLNLTSRELQLLYSSINMYGNDNFLNPYDENSLVYEECIDYSSLPEDEKEKTKQFYHSIDTYISNYCFYQHFYEELLNNKTKERNSYETK